MEQIRETALHEAAAETVTNHPSRKLSKWDEPDIRDTAGEVGTSS